jgi:hypothetical protein
MKALFKAEAQRAKMERAPVLRNPFNPQSLIYYSVPDPLGALSADARPDLVAVANPILLFTSVRREFALHLQHFPT